MTITATQAPAPGGPAPEPGSPVQPVVDPARHDHPVSLPRPRGPLTTALFAALRQSPDAALTADLTWSGPVTDAATDEDLQLALWCTYELSYRGLAGVDEEWEWQPDLVRARRGWERQLLLHLQLALVDADTLHAAPDAVPQTLWALSELDTGPSLSKTIMRDADAGQFAEFLIHRSMYHLKEADPHTWAIPRLSGAVKAALVTIQADEYGGGVTAAMHAQLFRALMESWGLDTTYGEYLERVPGVTLLASNLISLFGLNRRWRGALVGHLALFEMTSSVPNGRYARGHRRLGGDDGAARFFDEHVVADAVHEQVAAYDLAGGLARAEPDLASDIVFGAKCAAYADQLFAELTADRWPHGLSSLRPVVAA